MAKTSGPNPIGIVLPGSTPFAPPPLLKEGIARIPSPIRQQWAPAWFYSALNWLGKPYFDASNVAQRFNLYLAGSNVDPYARLGSTRLFLIYFEGDAFRLSIAADANSAASVSAGKPYPNTDAGIREMYLDLAASPVFPSVTHCYVPATLGPDLEPLRERIRGHGSPRFLREWLRPSDGPQGRRSGLRGLTNRSARRLPQYPQRADLQRRAGHRPVRLGTRL